MGDPTAQFKMRTQDGLSVHVEIRILREAAEILSSRDSKQSLPIMIYIYIYIYTCVCYY